MLKLEKILVPTDFSECSQPALSYGCALAARFGSELHLIHACPEPAMLIAEAASMGGVGFVQQAESCRKAADEQLSQLPPDDWDNGRPVVRVTKAGSPHYEILRYAADNDVDLIVIGTHGRSGLMHVLMGSVAESVVRKAPCPVLTVKPEGHQFVLPDSAEELEQSTLAKGEAS